MLNTDRDEEHSMPFPETKRVIYNKNPLDNVICQLRFPPILMIDSEVPSGFQNAIRNEYPLYEEKTEVVHEFTAGLKPQFPQEVINQLSNTSINKNHEFTSEDGVWKINLTRTFISISTAKYRRWEHFKDKFKNSYDALIKYYNPPFFTRIGLRYIDLFCRESLDLQETDWNELIQPQLLGFLSTEIKENVLNYNGVFDVKLADESSSVRIATSFVNNLDNQTCFMVDSDFYSTKRVIQDQLTEKLNFLNSRSSRLIRWIIKDKLHLAMEPNEL